MAARPENAGILAMECYFPQVCVPQTALEESDGCAGKYTVGLGQHSLSLFDDREDVGSVLMTAVANLMDKYGIKAEEVGRLEVGTETLIDKSKSIKTAILAQLFGECADIEGHDRIVKFKDSFNFRQHVIIIFEHLHMNLYKFISINKKRKPIMDSAHLKRISYQMI